MVKKLGELPNFLVLSSGTESFGNRSVFAFPYCCSPNYSFCFIVFRSDAIGVSTAFMVVFSNGH
jgi:hypothetical protein